MAHDHDHSHDDSYYVDQLCLVALSGAFGAICLTMSLWQTEMLSLILAPQFHPFVLASGVTLIALVLIRSAILWQQAGQATTHTHGHDHHHHHHDHHHHGETCNHPEHHHHHGEPCNHPEHLHATTKPSSAAVPGVQALSLPVLASTATPPPTPHEHHHHHHEHDHAHQHKHGHDHDHDHGWAPWRYVVVLVPVMMFLLGLPNSGPQASATDFALPEEEFTPDKADAHGPEMRKATLLLQLTDTSRNWEPSLGKFQEAASLTALAAPGADYLAVAALHYLEQNATEWGDATAVTFKQLEALALDEKSRKQWSGQIVTVEGQYAPHPRNKRFFTLVRFRIQCCAADAIQLNVPIISREPLTKLQTNDWISVTGRVRFRQIGPKRWITVLYTQDYTNDGQARKAVRSIPPAKDYYLQ